MKRTKKVERRTPVPLQPWNCGEVVSHLLQAADIISGQTLGYSVSERTKLMETITRLSLIWRKTPRSRNREVGRELSACLDEYEKTYSWMHKR